MAKILVVDDSRTVREMVKASLELKAFEVITACNGEEAIEKTQEFKPDLIIMDLMMPVKDGYTALKELREKMSNLTPVIVFTGKQEAYMRDLFVFENISGFIEKDASPEELFRKVAEALKSRDKK